MPKATDPAKQREKDQRQTTQHYLHWGVKTMVGLVVVVGGGLVWLAWALLTK